MTTLKLSREQLTIEIEKAIASEQSVFWSKSSDMINVWRSSNDYFSDKGACFVADGRDICDVDLDDIRADIEFYLAENSDDQEDVLLVG